jgi:hypothetical protein
MNWDTWYSNASMTIEQDAVNKLSHTIIVKQDGEEEKEEKEVERVAQKAVAGVNRQKDQKVLLNRVLQFIKQTSAYSSIRKDKYLCHVGAVVAYKHGKFEGNAVRFIFTLPTEEVISYVDCSTPQFSIINEFSVC